jgi:hypothetical protein
MIRRKPAPDLVRVIPAPQHAYTQKLIEAVPRL